MVRDFLDCELISRMIVLSLPWFQDGKMIWAIMAVPIMFDWPWDALARALGKPGCAPVPWDSVALLHWRPLPTFPFSPWSLTALHLNLPVQGTLDDPGWTLEAALTSTQASSAEVSDV